MAMIIKSRARKATATGPATAGVSAIAPHGPYTISVTDEDRGSFTVELNDIELGDLLRFWLDNEANVSANCVNSFLSRS